MRYNNKRDTERERERERDRILRPHKSKGRRADLEIELKGHHKAWKGQCFRPSLHRWLVKPILARKSKEREGMCMHPLVQGTVSAGARTHPLANSFIETKFPIAFHFLVLPLAPFLELIL